MSVPTLRGRQVGSIRGLITGNRLGDAVGKNRCLGPSPASTALLLSDGIATSDWDVARLHSLLRSAGSPTSEWRVAASIGPVGIRFFASYPHNMDALANAYCDAAMIQSRNEESKLAACYAGLVLVGIMHSCPAATAFANDWPDNKENASIHCQG